MIHNDLVLPLKDMCQHFQNLQTLIESVLEVQEDSGGDVRIRPDFDEALLNLDSEKNTIIKKVNAEFKRVLSTYKWNEKQIKLECQSSTGYTLRVSRKDDKEARGNKEFVILQTNVNGVKFVTGTLSQLNSQFKEVSEEYTQRQRLLQDKLLETLGTYNPILDDVVDIIAQVDVFSAWACMVVRSRHSFVRPHFTTDQVMKLSKMRHVLLQDQCGEVISNDVEFVGGEVETFLITGPNMGGKSTFMRSVALVAVLAQMGCYVPCESAELCIFDSVLCRVGAGDAMAHGVSTFICEKCRTQHTFCPLQHIDLL
jgi:DNA mismatch repair protein MSH2